MELLKSPTVKAGLQNKGVLSPNRKNSDDHNTMITNSYTYTDTYKHRDTYGMHTLSASLKLHTGK